MPTRPLLKRIALNGGLAAVVLAVIGLAFSEVAGVWLAGTAGGRTGPPGAAGSVEPLRSDLRVRLPVTMAAWGFAFVALYEAGLSWLRSGRQGAKPVETRPDTAEQLLEELLTQAEAAQARGQGAGDGGRGAERAEPEKAESVATGGPNTPGSVS